MGVDLEITDLQSALLYQLSEGEVEYDSFNFSVNYLLDDKFEDLIDEWATYGSLSLMGGDMKEDANPINYNPNKVIKVIDDIIEMLNWHNDVEFYIIDILVNVKLLIRKGYHMGLMWS